MKYLTMIVSVSFMLAGQSIAMAQVPPPVPLGPPLLLPPGPPPPPPPQPDYPRRYDPRHYDWCADRYRSYSPYDNTFQPYGGPRRQCYSPFS